VFVKLVQLSLVFIKGNLDYVVCFYSLQQSCTYDELVTR